MPFSTPFKEKKLHKALLLLLYYYYTSKKEAEIDCYTKVALVFFYLKKSMRVAIV